MPRVRHLPVSALGTSAMLTNDPIRLVAARMCLLTGGQDFETVNKAASLHGGAAFSLAAARKDVLARSHGPGERGRPAYMGRRGRIDATHPAGTQARPASSLRGVAPAAGRTAWNAKGTRLHAADLPELGSSPSPRFRRFRDVAAVSGEPNAGPSPKQPRPFNRSCVAAGVFLCGRPDRLKSIPAKVRHEQAGWPGLRL
jgi:hypothetical protein